MSNTTFSLVVKVTLLLLFLLKNVTRDSPGCGSAVTLGRYSETGENGPWLCDAEEGRTSGGIVIPASLKWKSRDKLDQANVNERVLFPCLDGLSR